MARVDLRCTSCAYQFFVSDVQLAKPEGVKCPSCLAPVGITGPAEGGPARKQGRLLEASADPGARNLKLWIGIGAGGLLVLIAAAVFLMGGSPPPELPPETSNTSRPIVTTPAPKKAEVRTAPEKTVKAPVPLTSTAPPPVVAAPAPVVKAPVTPAAVPELPADLLKSVRESVLSLKEWHLNLAASAPEKTRLEALLAAGKGGAEDLEFLQALVNGPRLRAVREEATAIAETHARLEKEAVEGLPMDKVLMNDGRVLHGKIVGQTPDVVKLERKIGLGSAAVLPLPRKDIKDVQEGKGIGAEFKSRWEAARKGDAPMLAAHLAWCKENALTLQASLTAYAILAADPGRAEARQEAGFTSDPVARMIEAEKQGGFITHEGRRWVPIELRDKLLRDGYAIVDGQWMARKDRLISVPGLLRYETQSDKPVQISGTLVNEEAILYKQVGDAWDKPDVSLLRRFYTAAPLTVVPARTGGPSVTDADVYIYQDKATPAQGAALRGEVFITVPLGAPILEASVMTSAEVNAGGAIAVSLIVDGNRVPLYTCTAKESKAHKLPDLIRGKTEVQLVAEITGRATYKTKNSEKRVKQVRRDTDRILQRGLDIHYKQLVPEYSALLFPSNNNTVEVFRLTGVTAEPAPGLDKLFENAREVLKKK